MKRSYFLRQIHSGNSLKFFVWPVAVIIGLLLFSKTGFTNVQGKNRERITIPLKSYHYVEVPNPEEEVEERTVQGKGKTSGGTNDWKKIYLSRLLRAINEEKRFPSYEKKKGFEDSVKVSLTILPSGRVKEYRLVQESRYPGFNMEARRIIREAVFPTFPEELDMDEITISFSMDFKLEYSE